MNYKLNLFVEWYICFFDWVALIFGISEICRIDKLVKNKQDFEYKLSVSIFDNKTNKPRSFIINEIYLDV